MLLSCLLQGYGSSFIREYVHESGAGEDMNVGEFWSDMHWEDGGVLAYNQDAARQRIVNWLDGHKASAAAFDFPTKGILQVRGHGPWQNRREETVLRGELQCDFMLLGCSEA
jgi:alpha-amylase